MRVFRRSKSNVAVLTDSTSALPAEVIEKYGIHVVPLRVHLGSGSAVDGAEIHGSDVAAALREKVVVTTSRPAPAEFAAAYQQCLDEGAKHVVSIHLAAALSGTWESATLAAQDFGHGVVRVVDSRATGMGLGFAVPRRRGGLLSTVRRAAEVQGAAVRVIDRTKVLFYVDTLEYLRRGGRVGTAASFLATSLAVKPLLQMVDGRVVPLEKVRTSSKAIARLVALTTAAAGDGPVDLAVHHLDAPERAAAVAEQLRATVGQAGEIQVSELGAVIGAHLGPGAIGTVVVRRS